MVARSRWASLARLLVCRRTGLGVSKDCPVARPDAALRRVMVFCSGERKARRARPSWPVHWEPAPSVRRARLPNRGVREKLYAGAGCHTAPGGKGPSTAITVKAGAERLASVSMRVQTARLRSGSRDCEAVKLLSTQIVRKTGESIFISNGAAHCMQRRRQRFPTVRMVGEVGNSEVIAKTVDIRACTFTAA